MYHKPLTSGGGVASQVASTHGSHLQSICGHATVGQKGTGHSGVGHFAVGRCSSSCLTSSIVICGVGASGTTVCDRLRSRTTSVMRTNAAVTRPAGAPGIVTHEPAWLRTVEGRSEGKRGGLLSYIANTHRPAGDPQSPPTRGAPRARGPIATPRKNELLKTFPCTADPMFQGPFILLCGEVICR